LQLGSKLPPGVSQVLCHLEIKFQRLYPYFQESVSGDETIRYYAIDKYLAGCTEKKQQQAEQMLLR